MATFSRRSPPSWQKGAKAIDELPGVILAVADRQDNGVPLVALDAFQVLHEESFRLPLYEQQLQSRVLLARPVEGHFDPPGMLYAHGDDTKRLVWPFLHVLPH